jgi:hypothetical protein
MNCEECRHREANVFLTQILDGETIKLALCELCAAPIVEQLPPAQWTSHPPMSEETRRKLLERPPDCPTEVSLAEPISIKDLARALHAKWFKVVAVLMEHDIYKSADDTIDFATASLVCRHWRVIPHKVA